MRLAQVGIYYGSSTGHTRRAAELLATLFDAAGWAETELLDVADYFLEDMAEFDLTILAVPTWNIGQIQRDWQVVFDEFDELDLSDRPVALLGLGDQVGYPDTFADAMAFFADKVRERGATLLGAWPAVSYTFTGSWALRENGDLVGLVLDEENQPELSESRLSEWSRQLAREYVAYRQNLPQSKSQP